MEDNLELLRKVRESLEMLYAIYYDEEAIDENLEMLYTSYYESKAEPENIVKIDELSCQVYKGKISVFDRGDISFQNDECFILINGYPGNIKTIYLSSIKLAKNENKVKFMFLDENSEERLYLLNLIDNIDKAIFPKMKKKLDVMRCIDVIVKYDAIPLQVKYEMIFRFKNFTENIFNVITELYDKHNSMYFKYIILEKLLKQLEYICNGNLLDVDKQALQYADITKTLLIDNLRNGNFRINGLKEKYKKVFSKYNELEQNMWQMWLIYKMTQNDFDLKEMCAYFNMAEDELLKSFMYMEFKSEKVIKKLVDVSDIDYEYVKKREK